ncbi:glycosyltransferase [Novosphingobium terrae]|uniref:glycosyltransferase n=1 Tax=Novosphingobium terrae TaxID=2726189 RepID=UPI00198068F7|nr:glycosyltransferase family 2 protein [Novosphingobium terrae]
MAYLALSDDALLLQTPAAPGQDAGRLRSIAVALPAMDEEADLPACLAALDAAAARYDGTVTVMVLANNCRDGTVDVLERARLNHARLEWTALSLLPAYRHAGWARRLAFDQAATFLLSSDDVLACTDADTLVAPDWFVRTIRHIDGGADAVAGRALTRRSDRATLGREAALRLNMLGRYYTALDWLRAQAAPPDDPWPRHFFEGGASIALTLDVYRRIGGAPTPSVAEDRALFSAVREAGGRVRHPLDVRVFTSSRTEGRAAGGMADTLAKWISQRPDELLHETYFLPAALDPERAQAEDQLSFSTLPRAISMAQEMIRQSRLQAAASTQDASRQDVPLRRATTRGAFMLCNGSPGEAERHSSHDMIASLHGKDVAMENLYSDLR